MAVRHVMLLTLVDDAPEGRAEAIVEALRALPAQIPELRSYTVGVDLGLAEGNATIAVVAEFDDADGWATYTDHPAHRKVIEELIAPVRAARTAVQHDLPG